MRARRTVRMSNAAKLAVGASVLAFPATAVAVSTAGPANASGNTPVPATALHSTRPLTVGYGHKTIITGTAPAADAGQRVDLEYRPSLAGHWRTVDRARIRANGHFNLAARLGRSGRLQVVPESAGPAATATTQGRTPNQSPATAGTTSSGSTLAASPVRSITVRPHLTLAKREGEGIVGKPVRVSGRLLPGVAGRHLVLVTRQGHRWITVARARTHAGGHFAFRYTPSDSGSQAVHVAFAGDKLNARMASKPETIAGMSYAEVSWYYDAGNTACGFHATYGIASRTLPCGSKVTLSYGGRTVVATVDDRGPFVYSRLFDLNQTTAGALGMGGVATVLASV